MNYIDPVCGMTVTEKSAHYLNHNAKDIYFCSRGCLEKFHTNPDKYLYPKVKDNSTCPDGNCSTDTGTYTCPMHPEVEQLGSGSCPKCGMALEPKGLPRGADKS